MSDKPITTAEMLDWMDRHGWMDESLPCVNALRQRLQDYDTLKAEVSEERDERVLSGRRLQTACEQLVEKEQRIIALKAEVVELRDEVKTHHELLAESVPLARAEKAEAALEAARPLFMAVEGCYVEDLEYLVGLYGGNNPDIDPGLNIIRAAIAYRAAKSPAEKGEKR